MRAFSIASGLLIILSFLLLLAGGFIAFIAVNGSNALGWLMMWSAGFVFAFAMFIEGVHVALRQIIALLNEQRKLIAKERRPS